MNKAEQGRGTSPRHHGPRWPGIADAWPYLLDAGQRTILFADVMRRRAIQNAEHAASEVPHVLEYEAELVLDGRTLERPVNYLLVRIMPPEGVKLERTRRPFVVIDPRAGHGPGIGGFKADSEIGVAMKAGHHCYFVGFLPEPVPGQTIEDIVRAEAKFLEVVIARHPEADGKPCVIGNCQAGWAAAMVAATRPELFGPLILAGAPLSYWGGVRGQYPMRYTGGLLGGSWLTALVCDLGRGRFDGALLVQNFENQNPANTLWTKQYNLYSKIDTEASRYLAFERWWGGHVTLNAEEIQFIVDELFIGNNLAAGELRLSDGYTIDLRSIRSPIVVFCSKGDNITPPQQALDWILDLYDSVEEIRALEQTIVYTIHETVGHLGIFVSSGVARKEHDEFASNIDLIDVLPPGLYEATFVPKDEDILNPELASGDWVMRCETRTLDDIRALGANDLEDERRFAAAARVSELNLALYRTFAQPLVRTMVTQPVAEALSAINPSRLQERLLGPANPLMSLVGRAAEKVRKGRRPAPPDNALMALQEKASELVTAGLDGWRVAVERLAEKTFHAVYGQPALQSALGIDRKSNMRPRKAPKRLLHKALLEQRIAELRHGMGAGGLREALVRSLLYVAIARGGADERGFEAIRRLRQAPTGKKQLSLADFKTLVREQYLMLMIDEEAALASLPKLLPSASAERKAAVATLRSVLAARGPLEGEARKRFEHVAGLFGVTTKADPPTAVTRRRRRTAAVPNAQAPRRASQ